MSVEITKAEALGTTSVTKPTGATETEQQRFMNEETVDPLANVGISLSYTKNLGNFESTRFEVRIDLPCKPDSIDGMFKVANAWADEKLTALIQEADASDG